MTSKAAPRASQRRRCAPSQYGAPLRAQIAAAGAVLGAVLLREAVPVPLAALGAALIGDAGALRAALIRGAIVRHRPLAPDQRPLAGRRRARAVLSLDTLDHILTAGAALRVAGALAGDLLGADRLRGEEVAAVTAGPRLAQAHGDIRSGEIRGEQVCREVAWREIGGAQIGIRGVGGRGRRATHTPQRTQHEPAPHLPPSGPPSGRPSQVGHLPHCVGEGVATRWDGSFDSAPMPRLATRVAPAPADGGSSLHKKSSPPRPKAPVRRTKARPVCRGVTSDRCQRSHPAGWRRPPLRSGGGGRGGNPGRRGPGRWTGWSPRPEGARREPAPHLPPSPSASRKKRPVQLSAQAATSMGAPQATRRPPPSPPSGPRSRR
jgi:hypothetical protein